MLRYVLPVLIVTLVFAQEENFSMASESIPAEYRLTPQEDRWGETAVGANNCAATKKTCPPAGGGLFENFQHAHWNSATNSYNCRRSSVEWWKDDNWRYTCPKGCSRTFNLAWPYCVNEDTRCIDPKFKCGEDDSVWMTEDNKIHSYYCSRDATSCNRCGGRFCREGKEEVSNVQKASTKYFKLGYEFPCLGGDILAGHNSVCNNKDLIQDHHGCKQCSTFAQSCAPCPPDFPHELCKWKQTQTSPVKYDLNINVCMPCNTWYAQFYEFCEAVKGSDNKWSAQVKAKYRGSWAVTGFRDWMYTGESYNYRTNVEVTGAQRSSDADLPSFCELSTKFGYKNYNKWEKMTEFKHGDGKYNFGWDPDHNVKCKADQQGHESKKGHGNGCDECSSTIYRRPTESPTEKPTRSPTTSPTSERTTSTTTETPVTETYSCVYVCLFDEPRKCESQQPGGPDKADHTGVCPSADGFHFGFTFVPGTGNVGNTCYRPEYSPKQQPELTQCPFYCDMIATCNENDDLIHCGSAATSSEAPICAFNQRLNSGFNSVESEVADEVKMAYQTFEAETAESLAKKKNWNYMIIGLGWVNSLIVAYAIPYYRNKDSGDYINLASE